MKKYYIKDFELINNNYKSKIDNTILKKINELEKIVGSPTYKKTPNFKKKWNKKKNFKTTILKKNDTDYDLIITLLNKMTKKNYESIKDEIINNLELILSNEENSKDLKKIEKIGKLIYEIACNNIFWCEIYSKLLNNLINKFPIMKNICINNFNNYLKLFNNIKIGNPESDYELFCKINKENEKRKSISKFFICLMKYDIIEKDKIFKIIEHLINCLKKNLTNNDHKNINYEITENLCILVIESFNFLNKIHNEHILNFITYIINLDFKHYDGINSKIYFKLLDLYEVIN